MGGQLCDARWAAGSGVSQYNGGQRQVKNLPGRVKIRSASDKRDGGGGEPQSVGNAQAQQFCLSANLWLEFGCGGPTRLQDLEDVVRPCDFRLGLEAVMESVVLQVIVGPSSFQFEKL